MSKEGFQPPGLTQTGSRQRFHTMVKASGAQCNLDCDYCFYLHKHDLLDQPDIPRMSDELLEAHIRQYIEAHASGEVVFSWQGGEPTLMGLAFFERIVELQQIHRKDGQRIENDLQTNGTLLDGEWAAFLKRHGFLVGLSIDGPAPLHDAHRRSRGGKPTHERVMHAVALLHEHQVPFSALCVVSRDNARRPIDVYRFLRDRVRPRTIQFIPGVARADFTSVAPGRGSSGAAATAWSVDAQDWGYFLDRIWDEWFRRDFGKVFVDQFENVVSMMFGAGAQMCVTGRVCGKALAIEHDGDLYACDHYVYPEYRLGNIMDTHEGDLACSETQRRFGSAKSDALPGHCRSCPYLHLCWGHCPKDRFISTQDGESGLHYLCAGLRRFYRKATASRGELARRLGLP